MDKTRRRVHILAFGFALPPLLFLSHDLLRVGRIPHYTGFLSQIATAHGLSTNPLDYLLVRANEHIIALPATIYAANVLIAHGDNRVLSYFVLLELLLLFALLIAIVFRSVESDADSIACAAVIALFVFSPSLAELLTASMAGVVFVTASVTSVSAILALHKCAPINVIWPVLAIGLIGSVVHSVSLLAWPALVAGAKALGVARRQLIWLGVTALAAWTVFAALYQPVTGHPSPNLTDVPLLFRYVGSYLASPFLGDDTPAWIIGWVAIALWIASMASSHARQLIRTNTPWHMIQGFVATNALATAIMRSELGGPSQPRFAALPVLFWLSFAPLAALQVSRAPWQPTTRRLVRVACLVVMVALCVPMYVRGTALKEGLLENAAYDPLIAEALVHEIPDADLLRRLTPFPEELWQIRPLWKSLKHVPFDRQVPSIGGGQVRLQDIDRSSARVRGHFDGISVINDKFARAEGWAFGPGDPVVEVIVSDERGTILGIMVQGFRRADLSAAVSPDAVNAGWSGYVRMPDARGSLSAYARTSTSRAWVLLTRQ